MRTRKSLEGFLHQNYYEDFARANTTVGKFLEGDDEVERMRILDIRRNPNHPEIKILKNFCSYVPYVDV